MLKNSLRIPRAIVRSKIWKILVFLLKSGNLPFSKFEGPFKDFCFYETHYIVKNHILQQVYDLFMTEFAVSKTNILKEFEITVLQIIANPSTLSHFHAMIMSYLVPMVNEKTSVPQLREMFTREIKEGKINRVLLNNVIHQIAHLDNLNFDQTKELYIQLHGAEMFNDYKDDLTRIISILVDDGDCFGEIFWQFSEEDKFQSIFTGPTFQVLWFKAALNLKCRESLAKATTVERVVKHIRKCKVDYGDNKEIFFSNFLVLLEKVDSPKIQEIVKVVKEDQELIDLMKGDAYAFTNFVYSSEIDFN